MGSQSAHGVSLPIWAVLQKHSESPAWLVSSELQEIIDRLRLSSHVEVVVIFESDSIKVSMEPKTAYGEDVLEELNSRSEFLLCPEGECEYDASGSCIWCSDSCPR